MVVSNDTMRVTNKTVSRITELYERNEPSGHGDADVISAVPAFRTHTCGGPMIPRSSRRLQRVSAQNVDSYLRDLEEPKRGTLQVLRHTILEIVPDAEEVISYRVPAFRVRGTTVAGFAAFQNHLSYLPFSGSVLSHLADDLEGYTMTKGALHFPIDRPLPKSLVEKLIAARLRIATGETA